MKKDQETVSYWQSNTDILSALLLVILLVTVVLILYLMGNPVDVWDEAKNTFAPGSGAFFTSSPTPAGGDGGHNTFSGGGGWDNTPFVTATPTLTPTPTPTATPTYYPAGGGGFGGGGEEDEGKVAVYAMIIDSETGRVIPEEDIVFVLYNEIGERQILNTYYPERVRYTEFATTEDGVFYLPEKVMVRGYYFANMNAPKGYYLTGNYYFRAEHDHDWPDPNVVRIPFEPIKSTVKVSVLDRGTGEGLAGATFDVIAAEDIITADGTLRHLKGDIVDTVVCDDNGYGESKKLYLGYYDVVEVDVPEYYAGGLTEEHVKVSADTNGPITAELSFESEKSSFVLTASDELYPQRRLEGLSFVLTRTDRPTATTVLKTDSQGRIVLTDLAKNVTYTLTQQASIDQYLYSPEALTVHVDKNGLINGSGSEELQVTNRMIRMSISVKDALFGQDISSIPLGLYSESGQQIRLWTSSALAENIEGITPGLYRLVMNGENGDVKSITVQDTAERQQFSYRIFNMTDILAVCGGAVLLLLILILVIVLRRRKK